MAVLVIDVGSSSVRGLIFDDSARPIPGAHASRPHQFQTTPSGASTIDAALLRLNVEACLDELLQHEAAKAIRVVGVDTFVGNLLGVDQHGNALTPIYTYADTRSADDLASLAENVDLQAAHQRTGCKHHTAYHPARLHWLRRTDPTLFTRVARWVDFGAYLYKAWFDAEVTSYSVAAWSGMLDRRALAWDHQWLQALEMPSSAFPPLADYRHVQVGLTPAYAVRWPALRDVPFCLPVGDGAAANIGVGAVDADQIALSLGTTAALRVVSTRYPDPIPDGLWSYRVDAEHHLTGGATTEGGSVFKWACDTLMLGDLDALEAELAAREPDSHGLTMLPLLAGERSPGWQADATGAIIGLRLSTIPLDILQAALEGVALRLALIAEQLAAVAAPDARVMAGGRALMASPAWAQMIADSLNTPLHLLEDGETTARGTAVLALHALGLCALDAFPLVIERVVEPRPHGTAAMQAARERQMALYQAVIRKGKA